MGMGLHIPLVGGQNTIGKRVIIPWVGGQNTMGRRVDIQCVVKFEIATQKQKSIEIFFWQEDGIPLTNRVLCLSGCTSPWYIDPHTHGILTPIYGMLSPLPMVYRHTYPWYFDPLPMV
jgi:hypothetical protein